MASEKVLFLLIYLHKQADSVRFYPLLIFIISLFLIILNNFCYNPHFLKKGKHEKAIFKADFTAGDNI